MGTYVFRLPDIGEGVAEAEIVAWHVKPGDHVREDAPLLDVMTDKATVDMTSPVDGTVVKVHGEVGAMAPVGSVLVEMEVAGEAAARPSGAGRCGAECPRRRSEAATGAASCCAVGRAGQHRPHRVAGHPPPRHGMGHQAGRRDGQRPAWPHPGGRPGAAARRRGQAGRPRHAPAAPAPRSPGLRRRIADKMQESKRHIPHFTYVEEFDLTELESLRTDPERQSRPKDSPS